jgi:Zn-dependent protease with chaperone function
MSSNHCSAYIMETGVSHAQDGGSQHPFLLMSSRIFASALALSLMVFSAAGAAGPSRDMVREVEYEQEVARTHPELLESFRAARVAYDKKDFAEAERLLRQVTAAAPESSIALRRLGSCLVHQGKRAEGLEACQRAVALKRSADNLSVLAYNLVTGGTREVRKTDKETALQLLLECRRLPQGATMEILAETGQLALELDRIDEFKVACRLLERSFPNEMLTHYFGTIYAMLDKNWGRAERELKVAEGLGLPHEEAERLRAAGIRSGTNWSRAGLIGFVLFGGWIFGLVSLFGLGFLLSKLTLRQVRQADVLAPVSAGEKRIRRLYRVVLNITGVYYYFSLPFVVVLVIGIVAGLFYLCLLIGRIPIKLMLLLVIGALVTLFAMVKSFFVRVKSSDPGRVLERAEAEGLWKLVEEVAESVGTRPVDEIRITPGTDLAVYERGTWREKLRNQARRVLILGVGVLNGFKQDDFRCVLAHEYGHFSNRDTAGGDVALRVQNDMLKFYQAMFEAGQATMMNAAFHFLRIYNFIFRRISHGATRLQEILADRVAAQIYGAPAFEGGLKHVIQRSIEFEAAANDEIEKSIQAKRPLQNLYELPAPEGSDVATELEKALNRETSQDDTHPSPRDRFHLIAPLRNPSYPPRPGEVWDLINDPEALRREMVALIETRVAPHREAVSAVADAETGAA